MIKVIYMHTPGPWKAVQNGKDPWSGSEKYHVGITSEDGKDVINGCGDCGSPWITNPEDLALMTRAPELLAENKRLKAELEALKKEKRR